ncbi:MAG: RNA polymerase-binding transcription factor CarD [Thermoleophilia bacterium]
MFKVGDNVVYPHHGAGEVLDVTSREVDGEVKEYLTIRIIHNDMTVMVPVEAAEQAGIRAVVPEALVEEVEAVLRDDPSKMPKNWNRRYKHNREKIKTGDIFEVAEVVRNLALRDSSKGLSTGEKQMFGRVKKILASELMYAKEIPESEAIAYLDGILEEICYEAQRAEQAAQRAEQEG